MRCKRGIVLFFLAILLQPSAFSQDFTGLWSGFMTTSGNQLHYELAISEAEAELSGYSLTVFTINAVENIGIKSLKLKTRKEELALEDDELVYDNYTTAARKVTMYSRLSLSREDSVWVLQGTFFTRSADRSSFRGTIRLVKQHDYTGSRLMAQLHKMDLEASLSFVNPAPQKEQTKVVSLPKADSASVVKHSQPAQEKPDVGIKYKSVNPSEMAVLPAHSRTLPSVKLPAMTGAKPSVVPFKAAAEIDSRKTEIIRHISFTADSLVLSLYDNGEVDGDTVSVVANGQLIIARQRLSTNPILTTIYLSQGARDTIRLIMYAENLGRIPPNTGILIIQDGAERHQVRFEGDLQKNAAVLLYRKQ